MRHIVLLALFLAIPLVCGAGEVPYSAMVLNVKGKVEIQRGRQKKPANLGCLLYPGDRVETAIGASVTVKYLESGLEEQWPENKRFTIEKLASRQADSSVKKKQGKIALPALKNPQSGASRFIEGEAPAPAESVSPIRDICPHGEGGALLEQGDRR